MNVKVHNGHISVEIMTKKIFQWVILHAIHVIGCLLQGIYSQLSL